MQLLFEILEDAVITLASTTFSRFTTSASNPWAAVIATFKPLVTVGGGGTTTNATTTSWIHADHLGSTQATSDGTGQLQESIDYYPYGAIRFDTSTNGGTQSKKYIAQTYDNETALNYLNARYMSGMNGNFTTQDPIFLGNAKSQNLIDPQSLNSYGYANGSPVVKSDPSGLYTLRQVAAGQASWTQYMGDVYDGAMFLGQDSSTWNYAMNNPIRSGAVIGAFSVVAADSAVAGLAAFGSGVLAPNVGAAYVAKQALATTYYASLTIANIGGIPGGLTAVSGIDFSNPRKALSATMSLSLQIGPTLAGG